MIGTKRSEGPQMIRRRAVLRAGALGAGATALAALLAACGGNAAPTVTVGQNGTSPLVATGVSSNATSSRPVGSSAAPAPTVSAPAVVQRGGKLIVAIEGDPTNFDPAFTSVPGRRIGRTLYDPLIELDEQGNLQPGLIERWEQPDATSYLFTVRSGVSFHDGTPLDAEAVKFHFDRHLDPATQSLRKSELGPIDHVDVTGPMTVKITLKTPFAPFLSALFDWSGFVISPTAYKKWGKNDYGQHPIGTGPFKFVSYAQDQSTVVERNGGYWRQGQPYLDNITFRPILTDSVRLTELRSGGVHIAEMFPFQDMQRLKSSTDIVISEKQGFRWDAFFFNTRKAPWTNKALRQAFNWAIDREAIQKSVYYDTRLLGYDPFFPGTPYNDPNYKPFARDVAKAKQLVAESGVTTPIAITGLYSQDAPYQRALQIAQTNLAEIGINLSISIQDSTAVTQAWQSGNYDFSLTWWGFRPDPDSWVYLKYDSKGSQNYYGFYNNPQVDTLIEQARASQNQGERVRFYRQVATLLNDDAPHIFFHYGSDIKGLSPKVGGFVHYPDSMIRYRDISLR